MIPDLDLVSNDFGLHSICSGSAFQAAHLGRVWSRHDGWHSVHAADGYVEES